MTIFVICEIQPVQTDSHAYVLNGSAWHSFHLNKFQQTTNPWQSIRIEMSKVKEKRAHSQYELCGIAIHSHKVHPAVEVRNE